MNELQNKILDVFKEVKKICDKHNLRYYAIAGTCIGVARHKGFIPWDDDIDIAMPYDDYFKFYEIAQKELPENLSVYMIKDKKKSLSLFMKVHDTNTAYIEEVEFGLEDVYGGIFVDIMPLSGVLDDEAFIKKIRRYVVWNKFRRVDVYKNNPNAKLHDRIIAKIIHSFGPYDMWSKKWEKETRKYDFDKSENTGFIWSPRFNSKMIFPVEWFSDYVELPFEDITIRCPIGYDKILTKRFGDYMTPPPENKQIGHHYAIIDFDNSYEKYKGLSYDELVKIMNENQE